MDLLQLAHSRLAAVDGTDMDDARSRSRYRLLVAVGTGAATVGSLTAAGVPSGAMARAARDGSAGEAPTGPAEPAVTDGPSRPVVRWEQRPRRTVVRLHRVVRVVPAMDAAAVPGPGTGLGGGTVTAVAPVTPTAPTAPAGSQGAPRGPTGAGAGSGPAGLEPKPEAPTSEPIEPPPPTPVEPEPTVPSTGS